MVPLSGSVLFSPQILQCGPAESSRPQAAEAAPETKSQQTNHFPSHRWSHGLSTNQQEPLQGTVLAELEPCAAPQIDCQSLSID